MLTLDALCLEIKNKRFEEKRTWQSIAEGYGINRAMTRLIALGYQPGRKIRLALGLAPSASIVVMGEGMVPDGAQAIQALQCSCGQWFIPNNPARTHCFICRPAKIKERP